jgi:polysaccharide biosynthesis/export protein
MRMRILWLFVLSFCFFGVVSAQQAESADEGRRGYLIGPGDKVSGKVLGEPEFSFESIVDEDGKIQVPFSDEGIFAKCRTEKELRAEVAKFLSRYLRSPQLSVNVVERNSRPPATVYGEVVNPQQINLTRQATLLELLSFSGGIKKEASGMIQVTRTQALMCSEAKEDDWRANSADGMGFSSRVYSVNSLKDSNPIIYPGDIVDVQKAPPVYVVGEVMRPGEFFMPEGGLPLMQAIAMASGTTREAKIKDVKVYRRKQGSPQPEVISVNIDQVKKGEQKDFALEPYDIVEVGKTKKGIGEIILEIATGGVRNAANTLPVRAW